MFKDYFPWSYTYSNYAGPSFADLVYLTPVAQLSATIASLSLDNCEESLPRILSTLQEYSTHLSAEDSHISVHVAKNLQQLNNLITGEDAAPIPREVSAIPLICTSTGFLPAPISIHSRIPLSGTLYELIELSKKSISDTIHLFEYSSERHEMLLQAIKHQLLDPTLPLAEIYIRPIVTPSAISEVAHTILRCIITTLQELMGVCFGASATAASLYADSTATGIFKITTNNTTATPASISPYHM